MTNKKVIEFWIVNPLLELRGSNLISLGNNKLYSYNTCIAEYYAGKFIINKTHYSSTSTKHQNCIINTLNNLNYKYILVTNIPINSTNLLKI